MIMMARQQEGKPTGPSGSDEPVAGPSRPPEPATPPEEPPDYQLQREDEEQSEEDSFEDGGVAGGSRGLELDEIVNYSINPNSRATPSSPISPAGSLRSSNSGGGGGANSATRRIFTPAFKQRVLDAYRNDPECIGNQRATARKFDIHRRQVQKWLQQLGELPLSDEKDQNSSDDQQEHHHPRSTSTPVPANSSSLQPEASSPNKTLLTPSESRGRKKQMNPVPRENQRQSLSNVAGSSRQTQSTANPSSDIPGGLHTSNIMASLQHMSQAIGNFSHSIYGGHSSNSAIGSSPLLQGSLQSHSNPMRPSPRLKHSPVANGGGGMHDSPPNGNGGSPVVPLDVVDELSSIFPREDFSLLRGAIWRRDVTLTKLAPVNNRNNRVDHDRENMPSTLRGLNGDSYQHFMDLFRGQNILSLLQSGSITSRDFANLNGSNGHLLQSFMTAMNPATTAIPQGSNGNSERRRSNDQHNFISPRAPLSTTTKARTVAVELAEQRGTVINGGNYGSHSLEQPRRPSQSRRKPVNGNGRPSRGRSTNNMRIEEPADQEIDPSSMVEVVTTQPLSSPSQNMDYGMDLSSTASSVIHRTANPITTTSTLRSKAMNKDYGFLTELGLSRRQSPPNGLNGTSSTASLQNMVENMRPTNGTPITSNGGDSSSNSPPLNDLPTTDICGKKDLVVAAFMADPELVGDARGIARKFQLNIRVVQKWIRESTTSRPGSSHESYLTNGSCAGASTLSAYPMRNNLSETGEELTEAELFMTASTSRNINGGVNRRKNSKPNQICDFAEEDETEANDPLDMVVPIKKRRVSTPTPTSN